MGDINLFSMCGHLLAIVFIVGGLWISDQTDWWWAMMGFYTIMSFVENISREQKNQSVQLGVIRENLSKLLERK